MPTYNYICEIEDKEFEEFHSIMIVLEDCPICKEAGREPHCPKRLISGGSGRGIVELVGNEVIENNKREADKLSKEVYGSEKAYANFISDAKYQSIQQGLDKGRSNRRR